MVPKQQLINSLILSLYNLIVEYNLIHVILKHNYVYTWSYLNIFNKNYRLGIFRPIGWYCTSSYCSRLGTFNVD